MQLFIRSWIRVTLTVTVIVAMDVTASSFLITTPTTTVITSASASAPVNTDNSSFRTGIRTKLGHNIPPIPAGGGQRGRGLSRVKQGAENEAPSEQTIATATFNLVKGCVGAGVLSLPAGLAAMGDVPEVMIPACAIFLILGSISAYTFHLIGRLVDVADTESTDLGNASKVTSLGQLWDKEIGSSSSWLITFAVLLVCYGTSLAYSIILGDTFGSLAKAAKMNISRRTAVTSISLFGVYPLCSMTSLAALKPVSIIGNIGILMTALLMTIRAMPGGMYSAVNIGPNFLATLPTELHPSFGFVGLRGPSSSLIVSSMAATAFLVHMAAPDFYQSLQNRSVKRFGILSILGFGTVVALSAYMMCVGFLTFGGACKGMILNNYSTLDSGATLCRLLMGIALLGSYAFIGNVMKNSFYQLFYKGKEITNDIRTKTTQTLIGTVTALALVLTDAGFVVSFTGAILGSSLIYIIPPLLFLKSTARRLGNGSLASTLTLRVERGWNRFLILLGSFLALAGGSMTVINSFFPRLL